MKIPYLSNVEVDFENWKQLDAFIGALTERRIRTRGHSDRMFLTNLIKAAQYSGDLCLRMNFQDNYRKKPHADTFHKHAMALQNELAAR